MGTTRGTGLSKASFRVGEVPDQIHPPSRSVPFDPLQSLLFGQPEVAQGMGPSEWGPVEVGRGFQGLRIRGRRHPGRPGLPRNRPNLK